MKNNRIIFLILILLFIIVSSFLAGCTDDEVKVIENMDLNETIDRFKKEAEFNFARQEGENNNTIISGFSPEGLGNTIIKFVGNTEEDTIEKIHFTYYMPEDMGNPEGDHLYNSIYLGIMLESLPNYEETKEWLYSHIQNIDDVEKTVDEETIINGNHIHVIVGGDDYRKLDLIVQNESQKN